MTLPLTLRFIPRNFRSTLFDDEGASPLSWDLTVSTPPPAPGDFSPQVDVRWNTTFSSPHGRRQRLPVVDPGLMRESAVPAPAPAAPVQAQVSHSAERLARAIALGARSASDPRTLAAWGQAVGISRGALRVWCRAAGVSARSSLDFLRLLRAVLIARHDTWDLLAILDVVDERSLLRLLDRGGIREIRRDGPITLREFARRQQFVRNQDVLDAVARELNTGLDEA